MQHSHPATFGALRRQMAQTLQPALGTEAQAAARALLCDHLGLTLTQLVLADADPVAPAQAEALVAMALRVAQGEPVQYVSGRAEFCGLEFKVAPGVLIPRPETEQLVEWVAEENKAACANVANDRAEENPSALRLLDIGTGSGCIAIALRDRLPQAKVSAVDFSAAALSIAVQNAQTLGLHVDFSLCDILSADAELLPQYHVVVSNPPYVCQSEAAAMEPNVLEHEPHSALFVPDSDPLLFYRRIAQLCRGGLLAPGGRLYFEINERFGTETADMLRAEGFTNVEVRPDYLGKPRMVRAEL